MSHTTHPGLDALLADRGRSPARGAGRSAGRQRGGSPGAGPGRFPAAPVFSPAPTGWAAARACSTPSGPGARVRGWRWPCCWCWPWPAAPDWPSPRSAMASAQSTCSWALASLLGLHLLTLLGWALGLLAGGEAAGALGRLWLWLSGKLARDARAAHLAPALLILLGRRRLALGPRRAGPRALAARPADRAGHAPRPAGDPPLRFRLGNHHSRQRYLHRPYPGARRPAGVAWLPVAGRRG